jgi:polyhydroxybutyrate depolymerase
MTKHVLLLTILFFTLACSRNESLASTNRTTYLESKTIFFEQFVEGDKINRPVIIQAPDAVDAFGNYPIVIALHGRGGSNSQWIKTLRSFTESGEFIGVYPQGHLNSWNLGQEPSKADDIAFIERIIDSLLLYSNVDGDRIFVLGSSNGAGLANKLGAESNKIKAIAPVASQLISSTVITPNKKPISVFQVNGEKDTTIPIEGGNKFGHNFLSAMESAEKWAGHFNCDATPEIVYENNTTMYTFSNCEMDVFVKYLIVKGAGHNVSMDYPQLWNEIWGFFNTLN